jgi:excisionase family DNA binding protein
MKEYSVREVALLLNKHEETIKRWIRAGKFPNGYIRSDKEGWRIPEDDLKALGYIANTESMGQKEIHIEQPTDETELINLAYQAVTLTTPTEETLRNLSTVGIERTLEILLIMNQSATKVKNPEGFIKRAIQENWSPNTVPIKMLQRKSKYVFELTQQDYTGQNEKEEYQRKVPFYNWLEE